ncbi:COP9 signalosome complex subunit 6A [Gigaspora rosea]|uniref:COP9 signalosome complex subunit 6 n=1 Tax=Gigaspora rosea TaxID=44941 RepID=A0A397VYQ7_9GLOM|nr:COP9 signalosome complex subunit 6A [Gigaspora rosea]
MTTMDVNMDIVPDGEAVTQSQVSSVVSSAPNNSGLMVALHPLTLLNISDHFTRIKMQQQIQSPQVIGALVGIQTGRDVEISNSYELDFDTIDGKVQINHEYFITKQEQFRQVFPQFDFLGWYTMGPYPTEADIEIHKQMMEFNESPLFLQMNPFEMVTSKNLPITVYESIIDIIEGQAHTLFIKSQYKIETGEAERIAVDHVAHTTLGEGGEGSSLIAHLTTQRNAIQMLHTRIKLLHNYLDLINSKQTPVDHDILRQIAGLCNRMPTIDSADFKQEFLTEYNDVLLTTYLATITKGTNSINELVDKFNIANSTNRPGGRGRHQLYMGV